MKNQRVYNGRKVDNVDAHNERKLYKTRYTHHKNVKMSSESTISDEDVPETRDRQGMIEYYVDELILRMVENPYDSTPQLFRHISQNGPCVEPGHVLHIFGGSIIFRRTCDRLSLIRDAALRGTLDRIPVDLARWGGQEQPDLEPPFYDFRDWWCPHPYDRHLFWYEGVLSLQPGMYRSIVRYPTHTDTDEFFNHVEEDIYPSDTNVDEDTEDSDWFAVEGPVNTAQFWEPPSESELTDIDMEMATEGNDNEEWGQPPPVNTMGPEWHYE